MAFGRLLSDVRDSNNASKKLGGDQSTNVVKIDHIHSCKVVLTRWKNLVRSFLLGVFVGVLPAAGSTTSIILFYGAVGIFALNNIAYDMWTLFIFGALFFILLSGFSILFPAYQNQRGKKLGPRNYRATRR